MLLPLIVMGIFISVPAPKPVQVGQVFSLNIGEEVQLSDSLSGLITSLKLNAVNDNRCPTDVHCIQAGEVTVKLEVAGAATKLMEISKTAAFYLTNDSTSKYNPAAVLAPGYELVLLQAFPYPEVKSGARATAVQLRVQPIKII
ncbi:hypothetical protein GCM10028895_44740 [Pontibacter rugosus]